jgi:hypothetical protein
MKSWRLNAEIWIGRHGLWFVPGLLAVVLAGWAWLIWLPAQEARLQSLLDQVATASHKPKVEVPAEDEARPLAADDPYLQIQKIFELAAAQGLQIAQAEYRRVDTGRIGRLQMQAPLRGTYPQVRQFLREVRTQLPSVSLDEFAMRRNENGLEAKVLLSVWHFGPARKESP